MLAGTVVIWRLNSGRFTSKMVHWHSCWQKASVLTTGSSIVLECSDDRSSKPWETARARRVLPCWHHGVSEVTQGHFCHILWFTSESLSLALTKAGVEGVEVGISLHLLKQRNVKERVALFKNCHRTPTRVAQPLAFLRPASQLPTCQIWMIINAYLGCSCIKGSAKLGRNNFKWHNKLCIAFSFSFGYRFSLECTYPQTLRFKIPFTGRY